MLRPRIPGVRPPPGPLPSYMGAPGKEPRLGEREELGQTHSMDPFSWMGEDETGAMEGRRHS